MITTRILFVLFLVSFISAHADEREDCHLAIVSKAKLATTVCSSFLRRATEANDAEMISAANLYFAKSLVISERESEAEKYFIEAFDEAKKLKILVAIAVTSDELGRYYLNQKIYDKALAPLEVATEYNTYVFGRRHLITLESLTRLAGVKHTLNDYQGAIKAVDLALQEIPRGENGKFVLVPNLYFIRALSLEKNGDIKNALPAYITSAQLMEGFDIAASIVIWNRIKATLLENKLSSELGAIDRKIGMLSAKNGVITQE